ncbi:MULTISPECIES: restriction endonuclease subunit S [Metallibacterium]|nr:MULTISPECIES: restriction endonuclease subunit S [Metallibacterium]
MAGKPWTRMPLGEFVTLQRGHDLPDEQRRPGSVPILGSFGITGWHDEAKALGPGVTVGRSGASFGVVSYSSRDYWPLNTALYVIDFHGNDPRFAYYFLQQFDFKSYNSGSAQPSLNRNFIHPVPVDVPPPHEQRVIAHILGTLDDKIELNRRMSETLEAMARALFKSWFVDFDPVRAKVKGRDPGLPEPLADLFPDSFVDSELGEIPRGWKVSVLSEILSELETGGRPKGGVSGYAAGTPSIGAESIVGLGVFDYSKTKYVPNEFFDGMTKGRVKSRDVLLYKDGGRPGEFEPHLTLVGDGFPFDTCAINEHVYRMRAKEEFRQNLLFFWLSSDFVMEEMRIKGTGVAIPGLNSTQVKSLTTLVPTSEVARAFDRLVGPWITHVLAACNESRTLAALRDTLLPRLISGNLRVPDAERLMEAAQ